MTPAPVVRVKAEILGRPEGKVKRFRLALGLRTRDEITDPFSISSSGHLGPLLNREILNVAGLRLRFRSIVASQSDPNLSGKCITYFIAGPNLINKAQAVICAQKKDRPIWVVHKKK